MCIKLGLSLKIDPEHIYSTWSPVKLITIYTDVVNSEYKRYYSSLQDKEKYKHPEVLIERILNKKEVEQYTEQRHQKAADKLTELNKKK